LRNWLMHIIVIHEILTWVFYFLLHNPSIIAQSFNNTDKAIALFKANILCELLGKKYDGFHVL